jgi:hypothetical protein
MQVRRPGERRRTLAHQMTGLKLVAGTEVGVVTPTNDMLDSAEIDCLVTA